MLMTPFVDIFHLQGAATSGKAASLFITEQSNGENHS